MIWHLYTRRRRGLLAPARFIASCGEPGKGWRLDSTFEADDDDEARAIAMHLASAIESVEVVVAWERKHKAAVIRAHAPRSAKRAPIPEAPAPGHPDPAATKE
jgi:hypothetical protein